MDKEKLEKTAEDYFNGKYKSVFQTRVDVENAFKSGAEWMMGLSPYPLSANTDGAGFLIKCKDYEFCRKAVENILSYFGEEYSITDSDFWKYVEAWYFETDLPYYNKYLHSEIFKMQCNDTPLESLTKTKRL